MSLDIVTSVLEKYSKKNGSEFHVSFNTNDQVPALNFTLGRHEQNGSIRVSLESEEIMAILRLNDIIGEGSKVDKILKEIRFRNADNEIEKLIYNTLSKYILQMLFAASGRILFPEIIPLKKHERIYFKRSAEAIS